MMRASEISPKMFENPFLDFFSRTHWLAVPIVWLPVVAALVGTAFARGVAWYVTVGAFALGTAVWTLTEYALHRTAFHWVPATSWGPRFHFLVHGVHHDFEKDPYRLVMPPAVSIALGLLFYGLFRGAAALLGLAGIDGGWHLGGFAGFVLGYVVYDCTHYMLHHWRPRSRRMKRLRAHHMNHHHNHPDRRFGVSTTLWDRVFGTAS
jgi:sterol desaturase/sphingolipid hydroxylase (fatty acid hydroxylase superfamily)